MACNGVSYKNTSWKETIGQSTLSKAINTLDKAQLTALKRVNIGPLYTGSNVRVMMKFSM